MLNVPYFVQPTAITCQSTCLKMYAKYLEKRNRICSLASNMDILDIWKEINTGNERPSQARNSYANMKWWLEKYFSPIRFHLRDTQSVDQAIADVTKTINDGFPVIVSTNHKRTSGHIILVIGYENYLPAQSNTDIQFICHDPFGRFNPKLISSLYGKKRYETGMSLMTGGEAGPGKSVKYDYQGIRRIRSDKHSTNTYYLLSGTR